MKPLPLGMLLLLLAGAIATAQEKPAQDAAAEELKAVLTSYMDAFNKQDIKTLTTLWAEDGEHVDRETGEHVQGRDLIVKDLEEVFKTRPRTRLTGEASSVRLISPDVALVEGTATLTTPEEEPSPSGFSILLVKKEGKWVLSRIEETALPVPATPYDALKELEWLVGEWKDEAEDVQVTFSVRWAGSQSFLIRSYSVQHKDEVLHNGTQVIGWDPRGQQFRSWTFNSDGSFSTESWSKNEGDWLIKSAQTLADGEAASGTYVLSPVDENSFTLRLIGHEVEGELMPATEPVTIVRVIPDPEPEIKPGTGIVPAPKKTSETPAPDNN